MTRILLAGFGTETSIYTEHRMTAAEFRIHRGQELAFIFPFETDLDPNLTPELMEPRR